VHATAPDNVIFNNSQHVVCFSTILPNCSKLLRLVSETLRRHYYLLRLFWHWCIRVISRREFGDSQFEVQTGRFMTGLLTGQSIYTKGCGRVVFLHRKSVRAFREKVPANFFSRAFTTRDWDPPGCKLPSVMYYA